MKTLPDNLRKNGFPYERVLREGKSCIYRQMVGNGLNYYEVFMIRIKPAMVYKNGKSYPEREVFPSDENFGMTAWSYRKVEEARIRFDQLVEKEKKEDLAND